MGSIRRPHDPSGGAAVSARHRRRGTTAMMLLVPLALAACSGTPGPDADSSPATATMATSGAPSSSAESESATGSAETGSSAGTTAPPLTGPLPSFTAEELAEAARELAADHSGARVRTNEEIAALADSGRALLDDMDITPSKCAPFMDNQEATLPAGAAIASVTIPGDSVERETYISLASYPEPQDAAQAVDRTNGLLVHCANFTLQLSGTKGTATLKDEAAGTDAASTAAYWMDVEAGDQSVASYTVSGSDGAVVVSVTTRADQEADIDPSDVAAMVDEALTALRTQ
ncbi:hypothetical protein [Arthrobacter sp. JSM 101049]|uniref:hypothetical protein n=1 Tax=Arthrobacter sp. JSM 101049 TaxID=929097 RepID=UPI003566E4F9